MLWLMHHLLLRKNNWMNWDWLWAKQRNSLTRRNIYIYIWKGWNKRTALTSTFSHIIYRATITHKLKQHGDAEWSPTSYLLRIVSNNFDLTHHFFSMICVELLLLKCILWLCSTYIKVRHTFPSRWIAYCTLSKHSILLRNDIGHLHLYFL